MTGSVFFPGWFDFEFLYLAGERVAAHAKQLRGLDAPAAGVGERPREQRFFELPQQFVHDAGRAAAEPRFDLLLQRRGPILWRRRHGSCAQFRRQVLISIVTDGAITVIQ